jgi:two-component system cell cycle sensor histidine kinase/response regulator CckA
VLVVEDEPLLLRSTQRMFELRSFEVVAVPDTLAAIAANGLVPRLDLLATDICLPGSDGIELALRLRDARPGLPVLFMSGLEAERALSRLPRDGTWAFLPKPFTGRELDGRLAELLGPALPSGPAR